MSIWHSRYTHASDIIICGAIVTYLRILKKYPHSAMTEEFVACNATSAADRRDLVAESLLLHEGLGLTLDWTNLYIR